MRVVGYVRVSTSGQVEEGVSLDMQAQKIKGYCILHQLQLMVIHRDDGYSARDIKGRPGFCAVLDQVLSGRVDGLVVWKLDRAFRSVQDALSISSEFQRKGKSLHSICENLNTTNAMGQFFFTLMASIAEMERKVIGERTASALAHKRTLSEYCGGQPPYGWSVVHGILVPHEEEQRVVQRAIGLRDEGLSYKKIGIQLEKEGFISRVGRPFGEIQTKRMIQRNRSLELDTSDLIEID